MKSLGIIFCMSLSGAESFHDYKKRPTAIQIMNDQQRDTYELLQHQARIKYAIMLHRQALRRIQSEQLTAIRKYDNDDYKAF